MGSEVKRAKKMASFSPPPTFHESQRGTKSSRPISSQRGKVSAPGPSAGRGAFLMAGYYPALSVPRSVTYAQLIAIGDGWPRVRPICQNLPRWS